MRASALTLLLPRRPPPRRPLQGQFGDTMGLLTQNLVTLIASMVIAFIKSWQVCLVVMAAMPVIGGAAYLQTKYMLGAADKEDETFAQANQTASEAFGNIRTIAAFSMEGKVAELFDAQLKKPAKESRTRALAAGAGFGASQFVLFAVYALAFWFGALLVSRGDAAFEGVLMAFFAIFLAAVSGAGGVWVWCRWLAWVWEGEGAVRGYPSMCRPTAALSQAQQLPLAHESCAAWACWIGR